MPELPENATEAVGQAGESALDPAVDAVPEVEPEADATAGAAEEPERERESRVVYVADEVLLASAALAQRALLEVTSPESVGSVIGHVAEGEHVVSLQFAADLAGYPGWHWSVTLARVDDGDPTVLETELMPGEQALLAPEWVPWSERLADYRAAQEAAKAAGATAADEDLDGDESDGDESDDPLDEDDLDGIDIDALDEVDADEVEVEVEDDSDDDDEDHDSADDDDSDDDDEDHDAADDDEFGDDE
jgi:hypothetical protein